MQLTELLYQRVKELGAQGSVALRPGYVAVVSSSPTLRSALLAALFPAPDDQSRLAEPGGTTRVGVGVLPPDGTPYRILREIGGSRQLQKLDPAQRKFVLLTEDALEIDSFLRVDCGFPAADAYTGLYVLEAAELPSARARQASTNGAQAAGPSGVDAGRVKALREEIAKTREFEGLQDELYHVQRRLDELKGRGDQLTQAEDEAAALAAELARSPWTSEQIEDLIGRAKRVKELETEREEGLARIEEHRERLQDRVVVEPVPFLKHPWFQGGIGAGLAFDAVAFALHRPWIALLGLLPFALALVAVLRWIEEDEHEKQAASLTRKLKEREDQLRKNFNEAHGPLKAALAAAGVANAEQLVEMLQARSQLAGQHEEAAARVAALREQPELQQLASELETLDAKRRELEAAVGAQGFARGIPEIEAELKEALGLKESTGPGKKAAVPEEEIPRQLIARAADCLHVPADELMRAMTPRLEAYLAALTDRRVTTARTDAQGHLLLAAADGRGGPYAGVPLPLRDLVYAALRLALLERVLLEKKAPVLVDDAFAPLDAPKRALTAKMLQGLGQQSQVIHRQAEPSGPGRADATVAA